MTRATLHGIFTSQARATPGRIAVEADGHRLTYGALNARANRLAHHLRRLGVAPDTTVAIGLERSLDLVVGILGILKAGGAYVPLDPAYPAERLRYMTADSGARLIVTRAALAPVFADAGAALVRIDDVGLDVMPDSEPLDAALPEHLAYIIYTSGSTGRPKGVLVEHRNVVSSLRGLQEAFPAGPDAAYLFKSNHTFDASLLELFGAMWEGGRTVILRPGAERDPQAVLDATVAGGVTHLFFVTSMMQALLDLCPASALETIRTRQYVLVGGEAMSHRLAARLRALGGPVRIANVYGPTETAIICAAFPLDRSAGGTTVPIGSMLGGLHGRLLDAGGREVPDGDLGELHIGGASVARGYQREPELTRQRFIPDPRTPGARLYRTGDLCRVGPGGHLEYVERVDRQIKIRGYRVELGEIETHLTAHPDVSAAAVIATGSGGDLRLSAYYVASDASIQVPAPALRRHLAQFLPDHMIPTAWLQMPGLPLNDNGKVDRAALPPIVTPRAGSSEHAGTIEEAIVDAWSAELGTRAILPGDDFFALGGHSLAAARVVVTLRERLGRTLSVTDLYRAPTVSALSSVIAQAPVADAPDLERAATGEALPLSYDQLGFWLLDRLGLPNLNVIARRRVAGCIDTAALAAALERVVAAHPSLRCRFDRWTPSQTLMDRCRVDLVERDFTSMDTVAREAAALASMEELAARSTWTRGDALVEARLVRLGARLSEVQIAMPHIVSDEASGAVFFDDLSRHYLGIIRREPYSLVESRDGFATFVREERAALAGTLQESTRFWETHLEDATPIIFPENEVLDVRAKAGSLYIDLPNAFVDRLRSACRDHGLGMAELLYAASLRAIAPAAEPSPRPVLLAPRSARDRAAYDGAIGLFARIDFLKVSMDAGAGLVTLARRVREADLVTAAHQRCPTIIKSAGLNKRRWEARDRWCRAAARAAVSLVPGGLDPDVTLAQARVIAMRRRPPVLDFSVAVNVLNSFVTPEPRALFGLAVAPAPVHPTYEPPFRRVLEFYFLRDAGRYQLMINGDLRPAFRLALGRALIREVETLHAAA